MKAEDNSLNNERLSLVNKKFPTIDYSQSSIFP